MKIIARFLALSALPFLTGCAWLQTHQSQLVDTAGVLALRASDAASHGQLNADDLDGLAAGLRSELLSMRTASDLWKIGQIFLRPKPGAKELTAALAREFATSPGTPFQKGESIASGLNAAAAASRAP